MSVNPLAGKPAARALLVNVRRLVAAYYANHPDASVANQAVAFGTSGHRGSALRTSFNEAHILGAKDIRTAKKWLALNPQRSPARPSRRIPLPP